MIRRSWIPALGGLKDSSSIVLRARELTHRPKRESRLALEELETRTLLSPTVSVLPIHPQEGLLFNGPVALISDVGRADPTFSYTARIDWGDGTAVDSVTPSVINGHLTATASHVYKEEAEPTLTVTATNNTTQTSGTA